jgi:hypothetical protein
MLGRERLSIVLDVSRHQLERYNITGAEAIRRGFRQAEIGRVDRRRYAGIGKEREHASVGPGLWLTLIPSNHQPKDAGPAAKKPLRDGEEY